MQAPAGQAFQIAFTNNDAGIPHNVEIKDANGTSVFKGEIINGVASVTYDVPALGTGNYQFICTVHPNMVGTLVVG
jgi:plastocyanin